MKKSIKQTVLRTAIIFVCLIIFYFVAMSAVYFIPNESVKQNFEEGAKLIYEEGEYNEPFFNNVSARLDGTTDIMMMLECYRRVGLEMSPPQAAMYINTYSRFWHGYQIFLRPALTFMSYIQLRYINTFFFYILLCLSFVAIKKHISTLTAILYIVTLMMTFSFLVPMCLQYMSVYMVTFISIMVMLKYKENFKTIYLLFFVVGSVINFLDFLTFPLLTLGLPFGVIFFAREKVMKISIVKKFVDLILCSVMWGIGYALTWVTKWALATAMTGVNIFGNASGEAAYRMFGNEAFPLDRKLMYWVNVFKFLTPENLAIAAVLVSTLIILIILSRKPFKNLLKALPVFLMAIAPYVWYYVFANHSQFHSFFTYRSQMLSVFIGFAFLASAVDFDRIKALFSKLFKKKKATDLMPPKS